MLHEGYSSNKQQAEENIHDDFEPIQIKKHP
jgi:hypothetical protein